MDELKINKEHKKALLAIRRNMGRRSNVSVIEEMIEDYLLREHGRLEKIINNKYKE